MRKIRPYILIVVAIAIFALAGYYIPKPVPVTPEASLTEIFKGYDIIGKYLSSGLYALCSAITLMFVCIVVCISVIKGRVRSSALGRSILYIFLFSILLSIAGYLTSWITALVKGYDYRIFHTLPSFKNELSLSCGAVLLVLAATLLVYLRRRRIERDRVSESSIRKSASSSGAVKFDFRFLCADLVVSLIFAAVAYIFAIPNYFLLIPIFAVCASLILWRILNWRGLLMVGIVTILLSIIGFGYTAIFAISVGGIGIIVPVVFLLFVMLLPICDIYCRKEKNI